MNYSIFELNFYRMDGEEYYEFVDEFMAAIKLRWPRALIQHEDFQTKHLPTPNDQNGGAIHKSCKDPQK